MARMRISQHNGRVRKSGQPYSPKHNDRNFDVTKSDNIDPDRVRLNQYWSCVSDGWYSLEDQPDQPDQEGQPWFEDVERDFYEAHFMPMYEASKERSRKRGQLKRVRPFDEWRKARQFVPEETSVQIGCVGNTVDFCTFTECVEEYMGVMDEWNNQHGEPFTILDVALHLDEEVPHLQIRRVWHSVDPETGIDEIGQAKALERAGVDPPDPLSPISAENNRKQTYDAYMREQWLTICEAHGLDIEREPDKSRPHNQTKEEYIRDKQKARTAELDKRETKLDSRETKLDSRETELAAKDEAVKTEAQQVKTDKDALEKAKEDFKNLEAQAVKDARAAGLAEAVKWERSVISARRELASLESKIGDLTEYRSWKAARDAEAAKEAARKQEAEEKAKAAAEAARKAQEAQEQARREQEAKWAALAAQEAARPKTDEERYQEARAAIFGGTAPQAPAESPKRVAGPSAMDRLKQATQAAARETVQNIPEGPDF